MNAIFEKIKAGGIIQNLARLSGMITWTWEVASSQGTNGLDLSWPLTDAMKAMINNGDRNDSPFYGCSIGSTSGYCQVTAKATFRTAVKLSRIYAKAFAACEQGNASQTRYFQVLVNGTAVNTTGLGQSTPGEWDDSTEREAVTEVKFLYYSAYSRPSGGGFAYGGLNELELYGRL